jgi:subtilase family serine protease
MGPRVMSEKLLLVDIYVTQRNVDTLESTLQSISDPTKQTYGIHYSRNYISELTSHPSRNKKIIKYLREQNVEIAFQSPYGEKITGRAPAATWEYIFSTKYYEMSAKHKNKLVTRVQAMGYSIPAALADTIEWVSHPTTSISSDATISLNLADDEDMTIVNPSTLAHKYEIPSNGYNYSAVQPEHSNQAIFVPKNQYINAIDMYLDKADVSKLQVVKASTLSVTNTTDLEFMTPNCATNAACALPNIQYAYTQTMTPSIPTIFYYGYEEDDYWTFLLDILDSPYPPRVVVIPYTSFTPSPAAVRVFNQLAMKAGLIGITIVVNSGDSGSRMNKTRCENIPSFPASSPYVLSVGATKQVSILIFPTKFLS